MDTLRRIRLATAVALLAAASPAGAFDYWLLSLSWSPTWCATEGGPDAEQCDSDRDLGFVLHGLWPQDEQGYPEWCDSRYRDPSRRDTRAMADIMGSGGLAWYQWQKHGRCADMAAADYFAAARAVFATLSLPDLPPAASAEAIERAVIAGNPGLAPDAVVITCGGGLLDEVRICLDRAFRFRACASDVAADACRGRAPLDVPAAP